MAVGSGASQLRRLSGVLNCKMAAVICLPARFAELQLRYTEITAAKTVNFTGLRKPKGLQSFFLTINSESLN